MTDTIIETEKLLAKAIEEYLLHMIDTGYAECICNKYERILLYFREFICANKITWQSVFTADTLEAFLQEKPGHKPAPVKNLARLLFEQGRIPKPLLKRQTPLPAIYEDYLRYYDETRQVYPARIQQTRRLLVALDRYLTQEKVSLTALKIEHLDRFWAEFSKGYCVGTRNFQRSLLRGFLSYIYRERKIGRRDLAPLLVGATQFAQQKPPRFLRPQEVQRLFTAIRPSTPDDLRTFAMLHLAYTLGLRPVEISRISLDDLSFRRGEITLPQRKACNPVKLPLPEQTMQAIAVYLATARPNTAHRTLFIAFNAPYGPLTSAAVSRVINAWFHKTGVPGSAYWLRHTYAQNLLQQTNASIFEIKELMGHDQIETTRKYLHIHINLMREALFDETL